MMRDLARMANEPPTQLAARVSHDATLISDFEFLNQTGMTRAEFAEKRKRDARFDFEQSAVADLDAALDHLSGSAADRYASYHGLRSLEDSKLAELQRKSAELEQIISAPIEAEGAIRAALRRTADAFLNGKSTDESDADKRADLDAKLAAHKHRAEAAKMALSDIGKDIDAQQIRCRRIKDREREFLVPVIFDAVAKSGLVKRWRAARDEMLATETVLRALRQAFVPPDGCSYPWAPPHETTPGTHVAVRQWAAVADQLRRDPRAEVKVPA
jgi:hypothetical protein